KVGFNLVGYGCTTCIGNSGPLPEPVSEAIDEGDLAVCAVLSGNRNFEGRIHAQVRANYLASPPLVFAYALPAPIPAESTKDPAGEYLISYQVRPSEFNTYGARRGNHHVMTRGTFANIRIRNEMVPGVEGGMTKLMPDGTVMPIYDAAMEYQKRGVPLVIFGGKEYGTGSSRDWAAKGTLLLGVKAVIVESFERIHRSNLVGMGVLPLQFKDG